MPEIDSDITDWTDDYDFDDSGIPDTNTPQGPDNPGETGEVDSLGAYLREVKSVIRRLTVDGHLNDPMDATRISNTSFSVVGHIELVTDATGGHHSVGIGQFLQFTHTAGGIVYAYVSGLTPSGANTIVTVLFPTGVISTNGTVRFSMFQPLANAFQYYGTSLPPQRISLAYPFHGGWVQCHLGSLSTRFVPCDLPWEMPSTDYLAFLTCSYEGTATAGQALCHTQGVVKETRKVIFELIEGVALAPGAVFEAFVWMNY